MEDKKTNRPFSGIIKALGPGMIFAGTSIGVSHIVHSTRAGANYGFALIGVVILANIFKYPFFEFGPRYVAATGTHLLTGYNRLGKWCFYLFVLLSLVTMFPVQAAVTMVTTGLFANLIKIPVPPFYVTAGLLLICTLILSIGKYSFLDKAMKVMIIILGISTVTAFVAAVFHGSSARPQFAKPFVWDLAGVSFLVVLMGWMPSTIDVSVWHSFWSHERELETNYRPKLKEALFDFHLGYWGTAIMALFFLSLGALVMYATGDEFSNSAVTFTGQIISIYTKALGGWSYFIIVTAASVTMFSTTISCLDAYSRIIREASVIIFPEWSASADKIYVGWMIFLSCTSVVLIGVFVNSMRTFVDFATTLSFLAAPIFGYLNLRAVTGPEMPEGTTPPKWLYVFSWFGIVFLGGFGLLFLIWRFFF